MRIIHSLFAFNLILAFAVITSAQTSRIDPVVNQNAISVYGADQKDVRPTSPIFIENAGQFDAKVLFLVKVGTQTAWLTHDGIVFDSTRPTLDEKVPLSASLRPDVVVTNDVDRTATPDRNDRSKLAAPILDRLVFSETFVNPKCCSRVEPSGMQPGIYNYFQNANSDQWRTNVRSFSEVVYHDVWPGIDLRIFANGPDLEQEFLVRSGGNPNLVQIRYNGIKGLAVAKDGSLEINTDFGKLREGKPRIFQSIGGRQIDVDGEFELTSATSYRFRVLNHNSQFAVVIDPTLFYSTFLGGSAGDGRFSGNFEVATGIAVGPSGEAHTTGYTLSADFPTTVGAFRRNSATGYSAFITKIKADGSDLVYSTYIAYGFPNAIAVDTAGNAYVAGVGAGADFPVTSNAFASSCPSSGFLTVLNPGGNALTYSTCLPGNIFSVAIAVDSQGRAYLGGQSMAGNLATTSNAYQPSLVVQPSGFISIFDTKATFGPLSLLYSTYLGSPTPTGTIASSGISGIAVDTFGKVYVTGSAYSGFPVTPGAFSTTQPPCVQRTGPVCPAAPNAFVAKLDPSLSGSQSLIYSTYLGGVDIGDTFGSSGIAIAVDDTGNAFATGATSSYSFPVTPGAFQTDTPFNLGNSFASFVTKLNPTGSNLLYSTYLGATCLDAHACSSEGVHSSSIAIDAFGSAFLTGSVSVLTLPVTSDAFQSAFLGPSHDFSNAFFLKLNANGSALLYSTYLGGHGDDAGTSIAVDQFGNAYIAGRTSSSDFPVRLALQPNMRGTGDAFVAKFSFGLGGQLSIQGMFPNHGGNAGIVTAEILGSGLQNGSTVKLTGSGPDIIGTNTTIANGFRITFDLTGATAGLRTLVITNPDNTSLSLPAAFTVEQGGAPEIWVDIIGRETIRIGRDQTYYVVYGNRGNIDTGDVPLWVELPKEVQVELGISTDATLPFETDPPSTNVIPLVVPKLTAGSSGVLPIRLGISSALAPFTLQAWLNPPYLSQLSAMGASGDPQALLCIANIVSYGFGASGLVSPASGVLLNIAQNYTNALYQFNQGTGPNFSAGTVVSGYQVMIGVLRQYFISTQGNGYPLQAPLNIAKNGFGAINLLFFSTCVDVFRKIDSQQLTVSPVTSQDPNDKIGSRGFGVTQYIARDEPLRYSVFFENKDAASAPAQDVVISDQLDAFNMDLDTFNLGPILFGTAQAVPKPWLSADTTTVDMRPAQNLLVKIEASLNKTTGLLTWRFASLDPATGLPPTDPLAGFLPPGIGGSVFFTVMPKSVRSTGTQIRNTASIVFDNSAAILTPEWLNTIDDTKPTSHVLPLASTQNGSSFPVKWDGTDAGSGIQDFSIYVSDNGEAFTIWQQNTTATAATFTGLSNHTYGFYSIARDRTRNLESSKTTAEVTTTVNIVDTTPPAIVPQISGTLGMNGWYRSDVSVSWNIGDPESGTATSSGCAPIVLTSDSAGVALTCSATNGIGLSSSVSTTIKIDKTPPGISEMPLLGCSLWPPNHKFVQVATVSATDALSGIAPGSFKVTGTSNQVSDPKDPDVLITSSVSGAYGVQLRADRSGESGDRTYTLVATAVDLAGNSVKAIAACVVPHDQGK